MIAQIVIFGAATFCLYGLVAVLIQVFVPPSAHKRRNDGSPRDFDQSREDRKTEPDKRRSIELCLVPIGAAVYGAFACAFMNVFPGTCRRKFELDSECLVWSVKRLNIHRAAVLPCLKSACSDLYRRNWHKHSSSHDWSRVHYSLRRLDISHRDCAPWVSYCACGKVTILDPIL